MSHLRQRVTILAHRFAVIATRREKNSNLVYDDRVWWNSCYSLDRLIIIAANNSAQLEFMYNVIVIKTKKKCNIIMIYKDVCIAQGNSEE